jgi:chitodextrinase
MPDVTAKDAAKDAVKSTAKSAVKTNGTISQMSELREISGSDPRPRPALDACYRQIGISAVAAAAQYQGNAKNPAYAPAPNGWRPQYDEELA